jgi:signal transduction histidine kinase
MSEDTSNTPGRQGELSITDRELFDRLAWFTHVRWAFGAVCLLLLLIGWYVFGLRLRADGRPMMMGPAVRVVLIIFLYNAVFTFLGRIVRARKRITRRLTVGIALAQVLCDLVAISLLIHFTGGVENFFIVIIFVPIVIVTELLGRLLAYVTAAVAAAMFNVLAWSEQQGLLSHVAVGPGGAPTGLHQDPLYVLHVTAAVTVTMFAMVFVASTIAARLRAREAELEDALRDLARADEAKGFFMRRAEHEMRSPLSAMYSILDALLHVARDLTPRQRELIERGKHRTSVLMELVNDMLTFSRLRSPRDILRITDVRLDSLVFNTVQLLGRQAEEKGLTLGAHALPVTLRGDEELLRELVTNLVANAVQYTPSGGTVDVRLRRVDGRVELTVADTGIGISDRAREHLFEEFYRAPEAKKAFPDGTGMGLAIVHRVVEIHAGTIDVTPNRPTGTVFRVTLPIRK